MGLSPTPDRVTAATLLDNFHKNKNIPDADVALTCSYDKQTSRVILTEVRMCLSATTLQVRLLCPSPIGGTNTRTTDSLPPLSLRACHTHTYTYTVPEMRSHLARPGSEIVWDILLCAVSRIFLTTNSHLTRCPCCLRGVRGYLQPTQHGSVKE